MKAKTIRWIDTNTRKVLYGIEINTGTQKLYAKDDDGAILSDDKAVIMRKVREFNRQHRFA